MNLRLSMALSEFEDDEQVDVSLHSLRLASIRAIL